MSYQIFQKELHKWCSIFHGQLENHPVLPTSLRIVKGFREMGEIMARDFAEEIKSKNDKMNQ